jgi:hypothetical protein
MRSERGWRPKREASHPRNARVGHPKVQLRKAERRQQKQIPSRNADRDANAARRPGIALRAPGLARDDSKDGPKRRRDHEPALRKQSKLRGQN